MADPRMPSAAKRYLPPAVLAHELPPDYSSLVAVMLGIMGIMLRNKIWSWLALIFCAQSLANLKNFESDLKQIIMAVTFVVMGMVTNYMNARALSSS